MSERALSLAPDAPPPPTLNRQRLAQIAADSSQAFVSEIAQAFVSDTEKRVAELAEIVASQDAERVADAAHFLRGAAASLGVVRLGTLAAALERYAKRGDWSKALWALERILGELSHVKNALRTVAVAGGG